MNKEDHDGGATPPRNPKINPQDGDVFRKGNTLRVVLHREHGQGATFMANMVQCRDAQGESLLDLVKPPREIRATLKQFRKWAEKSSVERRGDRNGV